MKLGHVYGQLALPALGLRFLFTLTVACVLAFSSVFTAFGDTVFYGSNSTNPAYDDIGNTLTDVYGNSTIGGTFNEVNYGLYQIGGSGNQSITMTFLYDDGAYQFTFGYFEVTAALEALPSNTVAEKQAWAVEALSSAVVVFTDAGVQTDANDLYTSVANDANRDHDTGSGDDYETVNTSVVTLQGGSYYSFFIIPNNTLTTFLNDYNDNNVFDSFALDGDGVSAWPLFAISQGNPGEGTGGSGEGLDQAFTFFGTTRNTNADALSATGNNQFDPDPGSPGSVITFEDITRRTGAGSDNDFNDLHFYIDNTLATGIVVPEPSTWITGAILVVLLGWEAWRRVPRQRGTRLCVGVKS